MKRICYYVKSLVVIFVLVLFSTGCDGNITRDIRHAGFSLSNASFTCSLLLPEKETKYEKLWYLDSTFAISQAGKVYELSLDQKYANQQNCKEAEFSGEVVSILDNKIVKGKDNQLYYMNSQTNVAAYSMVTATDNSYPIYALLFSDPTISKIVTIDQGKGIYYALKTDGNIYKIVVSRADMQSPYQLTSSEIIYSKDTYGKIEDFYYSNSNPSVTYIWTADKVMRMLKTNEEECSKYADVECKYQLSEDTILTKYQDKVFGYNGSLLITTYGKQFSVAG